jgi:hypothetical protein
MHTQIITDEPHRPSIDKEMDTVTTYALRKRKIKN